MGSKKIGLLLSDEAIARLKELCELTVRKPSAMVTWLVNREWEKAAVSGQVGEDHLAEKEKAQITDCS